MGELIYKLAIDCGLCFKNLTLPGSRLKAENFSNLKTLFQMYSLLHFCATILHDNVQKLGQHNSRKLYKIWKRLYAIMCTLSK